MLRKIVSILFSLILIISLPVTAKADIGPKPSVRITFTGIEVRHPFIRKTVYRTGNCLEWL